MTWPMQANVTKRKDLNQDFFYPVRKEYIVNQNYDLKGKEIVIPEGCTLRLKKGSISNGTIRLSNNVTIEGNGAVCFPTSIVDKSNNITNKTFILAEGVSNISINNIVLKGSYHESMGNLPFRGKPTTDSEHLIYIGNCKNIKLSEVTISNFYSNKVPAEWYKVYSSRQGLYPLLIHSSKDIEILNCKQRESAGEAWNIFYSDSILIDDMDFTCKYGVSYLTIMYCNNVAVRNSRFVRKTAFKYDSGNLVNIFSSNVSFLENIVDGGDYDWGNEHVNCQATIDYRHNNFTARNMTIENNQFRGCKITNNTEKPKQGELSKYIVDDIIIRNNSFVNALMAMSFGARGGIKTALIDGNVIECSPTEHLSSQSRYQPIVAYNTCPNEIVLNNNTISSTEVVYKYSFKGPMGSILINEGERITISDNRIKGPFGIKYRGGAELTVKGNRIESYVPQTINVINGSLVYTDNILLYNRESDNTGILVTGKRFKNTGNVYSTKVTDHMNSHVDTELIRNNVFTK